MVRLPAWFHARERVTAFAKIRASLLNVSSWAVQRPPS